MADFDRYAEQFEKDIDEALIFSGQKQDFFMQAKVEHLKKTLRNHFASLTGLKILDAGCGNGRTESLFQQDGCRMTGVDISAGMIVEAKKRNPWACYEVYDGEHLPFAAGEFDALFSICVLHHVPTAARPSLTREFSRVVRPGGLVLYYEHNPWNPLTRLTVFRCVFDQDAVLLRHTEAEELLADSDVVRVSSEFLLVFPFSSAWTNSVERSLRHVPIGAQYCTYGVKAECGDSVGKGRV